MSNKQIKQPSSSSSTISCFIILFVILTTINEIESKPLDLIKEFLKLAEFFTDYDYDDDLTKVTSSSGHSSLQRRSSATELCILPARKGHCRALLPRWSYDPVTKTCAEFKFGGCDGNANNFMSYNHCMTMCKGI